MCILNPRNTQTGCPSPRNSCTTVYRYPHGFFPVRPQTSGDTGHVFLRECFPFAERQVPSPMMAQWYHHSYLVNWFRNVEWLSAAVFQYEHRNKAIRATGKGGKFSRRLRMQQCGVRTTMLCLCASVKNPLATSAYRCLRSTSRISLSSLSVYHRTLTEARFEKRRVVFREI
jgi:hypothetical protein